jgi:hypothetical protein
VNGKVEIPVSGWLILRAWNEHADPKVQDIYPYASTSPIYITVDRQAPRSPEDATYFVSWLDRVIAGATARNDYNSAQEKQNTLQYLSAARTVFQTKLPSRGQLIDGIYVELPSLKRASCPCP